MDNSKNKTKSDTSRIIQKDYETKSVLKIIPQNFLKVREKFWLAEFCAGECILCKRAKLTDKGININEEKLSHLRFADDIVLVADRIDEARELLNQLYLSSLEGGLKINITRILMMKNLVVREDVSVGTRSIDHLMAYKSLIHEIRILKYN